jgi:X-X-X-Leu-X-X-Gly heptad repeat protein
LVSAGRLAKDLAKAGAMTASEAGRKVVARASRSAAKGVQQAATGVQEAATGAGEATATALESIADRVEPGGS